jgi:hypothetical protein
MGMGRQLQAWHTSVISVPDPTKDPVFVLTSDVDWASEYCVESLLAFAGDRGITPTIFATHRSAALAAAASQGRADLGIHPNFLPGSTHGSAPADVIRHCLEFAPNTPVSRSHAFVDGTHIAVALRDAGIKVDSNLCLYLQPGIGPLRHWTGIVRLPVFWEDDVHWMCGGSWRFSDHESAFFTPGLKIINTHPFNFTLNLADGASYLSAKSLLNGLTSIQAQGVRNPNAGTATFLAELCDAVARRGHKWNRLLDIAASAV